MTDPQFFISCLFTGKRKLGFEHDRYVDLTWLVIWTVLLGMGQCSEKHGLSRRIGYST